MYIWCIFHRWLWKICGFENIQSWLENIASYWRLEWRIKKIQPFGSRSKSTTYFYKKCHPFLTSIQLWWIRSWLGVPKFQRWRKTRRSKKLCQICCCKYLKLWCFYFNLVNTKIILYLQVWSNKIELIFLGNAWCIWIWS